MEAWMNRRGLVILVVVAALTWAATCVEAQDGSVAFTVEEPRIDLGEIRSGTDAVATFTFHNDGDQDVRILRAKPS
jgi:hypothetical protein